MTPHAYSFTETIDGRQPERGILSSFETGQIVFVIPGYTVGTVTRQGILQPGRYQLGSEVRNSPLISDAHTSFEMSFQLAEIPAAPTPEPGTMIMIASGGLLLIRRAGKRHG
jgi:hypothetical protein